MIQLQNFVISDKPLSTEKGTTAMNDNIKQLINGYEFDLVYPTVVEQAVETFRNLTNALFAVGQFKDEFQDTDADYIEKHLGWSHQSPTHVTLAIR